MRAAATTQPDVGSPLGRSIESWEMSLGEIESIHLPVLCDEVLQFLEPHKGGWFLDATIGLGGHAQSILELAAPRGRLIGIDRDAEVLELAARRLFAFQGSLQLVHSNFSEIRQIAAQRNVEAFRGILADLGVSSLQLSSPDRGFSFQMDGPIDMRMDRELDLTAAEVVNHYPERDLANMLFTYGEERRSRTIAKAIVKARPLRSTKTLAQVIAKAVRSRGHSRVHPATRTFLALRIYVNDELSRIPGFIRSAAELLAPGGRLAIISFHSLEDRIVKDGFRNLSRECICPPQIPQCQCGHQPLLRIITKKPVVAGERELERNPRSRSAKLRVAEKV